MTLFKIVQANYQPRRLYVKTTQTQLYLRLIAHIHSKKHQYVI